MKLRDIFAFRDPPESETSKPFLEHLEDLRWTIVKMAIVLIVAMFLCFAFRQRLVLILQRPLSEVGGQIGALRALGITDSITISFHLAFYAGIVISFPLLLYFLAQFVLPALTAVEKRFLFPAIVVSFGLFLTGVATVTYWLLPKTILFFFHDTQSLGWTPMWTVQQYYSFVTRFVLGFGLAFELPVVVLALVKFGLVTYQFMARTRPYAIVLIFILATIITPTPDVSDPDRAEPADVPALRELHLDCVVHAAQSRPRRIALTSGHVRGVYELIFRGFAFMLGAAIGSFLNVCIYRLPRDLSVNQPRRSFCPSCKKPIPWHQNLPLLSWLLLRGKCANCGSRIAFRYFAVELLTALLFLAVWLAFPWPITLVYWIFVSLLVVATFIDFEHFIIPDEITIGGTVAGLLASVALPALMGEDSRWRALAQSLGAAALGYVLLWIVLEAGKKAFREKTDPAQSTEPNSVGYATGMTPSLLSGKSADYGATTLRARAT